MAKTVTVPVKVVGGSQWADLSALAPTHTHQICAEQCKLQDNQYSFQGGHRVRLWGFKKNVHWRLPIGTELDIEDVAPADGPAPRRHVRRHG